MWRAKHLAMLVLASAALSGALLHGGCSPAPRPEEPTPTPIPTPIVPTKPTYQVQRGSVEKRHEFTGRIEPVTQKTLFFRRGGYVRGVFAKVYDRVTKGQVLAELVIDDLERELSAAQLELERAKAKLEAAEREWEYDLKRAQVELEIAQFNLEMAKVQDPEPRRLQAEADLKKVQITLQKAQERYNAVAWRNDLEASAEAAALQQATLDYAKAEADYQLALQAIANYPSEVAILERQVKLAQLALDELQGGVDPLLENDVQKALDKVSGLEASIADAQIIAPFDGQVVSNNLSEGYSAEAFKPAMVVADPSELEVRAQPETLQLQDLEEGMPVTIRLVSKPGKELTGVIRRLPSIYGKGARSKGLEGEDEAAHISLDEAAFQAGYQMGDLVRVVVVAERRDDVLWLPPQAIRTFEGRDFVVVQDGDIQRRVDVKLGVLGSDRVEIKEGLTEGQVVVSP